MAERIIRMKLLAVDGNSILNRAYYGIKPLTNKEGVFTNAVYGFMTMWLKMMEETAPDMVAVAFDMRGPTFRHGMYDAYKANRKGMPQELAMQLPLVQELLSDMGVAIVQREGYEGDDILGTLSLQCAQQGVDCVVASGDRDNLQLVGPHTVVRLVATKSTEDYDEGMVQEKYGVTPAQLIEVKALMGDTSDNIPGVKGIGEKTAIQLVQQCGSVDALYADLDAVKCTQSVRKKLEEGRESAILSRKLAVIARDVPLSDDLSGYLYSFERMDRQKTAALLKRLEVYSLLGRLGLADVETAPVQEELPAAQTVGDVSDLHLEAGDTAVLMLSEETLSVLSGGVSCELTSLEEIRAVLESSCTKKTLDAKLLYEFAIPRGIDIQGIVFDVTVAAYLLNANATDYSLTKLRDEYGIAQNLPGIQAVRDICRRMEEEIEQGGMRRLMEEIELPLSRVLADMEDAGIEVDVEGVRRFGGEVKSQLEGLEEEIHRMAGSDFNINSPKQLGVVLFETLGLPVRRRTKSGYSTDAEVLDSLRQEHPIVEKVLEYRKLAKMSSGFIDTLLDKVGADGRIHSYFRQTETRTGRISSTEPNLQNIPARTQFGRTMRRFFVAGEGKVLLDADYSQIELRVLAHIADDPNMIAAFQQNRDIHAMTASQVFGMPLEMVTPEMRTAAKAVNFGIVYGIGAFSLSKDIGVTVKEAEQYIKGYLSTYSGVDRYMSEAIRQGREKGYVTTLFGRRRYVPELAASNRMTKAFGERVAMNAPIQGTAADIIKIAMVRVYDRLRRERIEGRLILQVHDELILEVSDKDADRAAGILKEEMEHAVDLTVPMLVDVQRGKTWYDTKGN